MADEPYPEELLKLTIAKYEALNQKGDNNE